MIFGCQSSIIHTSVDIQIDIQERISMQGYSAMDIRKQISINGHTSFYGYHSSIIHAFMDIHLDILGFLWISIHWLAMDSRSRGSNFFKPIHSNRLLFALKIWIYQSFYLRYFWVFSVKKIIWLELYGEQQYDRPILPVSLRNSNPKCLDFSKNEEVVLNLWKWLSFFAESNFRWSTASNFSWSNENSVFLFYSVLVLDQGRLVEMNSPSTLVQNTSSVFHGMAKDAGLAWKRSFSFFKTLQS